MLDGLMLAHELVERVAVEASHEQENHARALPPATILPVLGQEQLCREADAYRLSGPGSPEPDELSNAVSQRQESQEVQERYGAERVVLSFEVVVGQVFDESNRVEGENSYCDTLYNIEFG
jgi:hypothetical protein